MSPVTQHILEQKRAGQLVLTMVQQRHTLGGLCAVAAAAAASVGTGTAAGVMRNTEIAAEVPVLQTPAALRLGLVGAALAALEACLCQAPAGCPLMCPERSRACSESAQIRRNYIGQELGNKV